MKKEMHRDRVKGFLDVNGKKIINGDGEEILLSGWGLGNWLLCEGYMWRSEGCERFDRPRRIEAVITELVGTEYAQAFWRQFRENYITQEDIRYMAQLGYNSVRIPMNARLLMKEEPGAPQFIEEGFALIDRCLTWCREYGMYAFLDLHGAPGGQTGANIDDCIDDMPRLLMDQECFDRGIVLWREIANRYKDEWIVGGYDLLNEPIRPKRSDRDPDVEYLLPRLQEFYEKAIAAVREVDQKHLFTLEGHHWASDTSIFHKKYDDKMVLHFHRYACQPDIACYQEFLDAADRLGCPLWLGETGENVLEWFTAMYPLAAELSIGYNLWPWKKMDCANSPCSVKKPKDWDLLIGYAKQGRHPGYTKAREILEEYLDNMKLVNCELHPEVTQAVFRQPGCVIRGTDFDQFPGRGISCSGVRQEENIYKYRMGMGMKISNKFPNRQSAFGFDCGWERFVLILEKDEFACYSLYDVKEGSEVIIHLFADEDSRVEFSVEDQVLASSSFRKDSGRIEVGPFMLPESEKCVFCIKNVSGKIEIEKIITSTADHSYSLAGQENK